MEKPALKKILCCSGGGCRGVMAAQFIKNLEKHLNSSIYDEFDMFAGTSSGSLIVSALSYNKMSAKQLSDVVYSHENCVRIMTKSIPDSILGLIQTCPKYENNGLYNVIDEYISPGQRVSDTTKDVILTAFDVDRYTPIFFKSFNNKRNIQLRDAMVMSCAAPGYFPGCYNNEYDIHGIDGGVTGCNNPSLAAYSDALKLYGKDADIRVLSIGTGFERNIGRGKESQHYGGVDWLLHGDLINLLFDGPQMCVNYHMNTFTKALGHKYIHIDKMIPNGRMDDVSENNIISLKNAGDDLWKSHGQKVIDFLL